MKRSKMRAALPALVLVMGLAAAPTPARSVSGEASAADDKPPGCTTATSEDVDGCGAQGRDHFSSPNHRPPVEACRTTMAPSGSTITRIVPDGPRRPDGSPAFVTGACVYLPPGYATSGLRYPVIHLLHGGGGDEADWVTAGRIREIMDRAATADPARAAIVVMPDGRSGQWYDYENSRFLIETYVIDHLVPYVDRHFRTIPDRAGRAAVGLSNGGYGAIHLAGKRPDLFVTAGGMSSNLGARTLSGLGPDGGVHHQGSVPYQLAENYDQVDLVLDVATRCTDPNPYCATIAVDLLFTPDHVAFQQRMQDIGHRGALDVRMADGAHQFTWWSRWLEERQLPFVQQRLADPAPTGATSAASPIPASFRYRSIKPSFSVWGYDVTVKRAVREFLDLRDVRAGGFTVKGSGRAVVTTAAYYRPGATYRVTGAGGDAAERTADERGRLRIEVDLGPSHTVEQFTREATVAEAADPGYWVVRDVVVTEASGAGLDATPPPSPATGGAATGSSTIGSSSPGSGSTGGAAGLRNRSPDAAVAADLAATVPGAAGSPQRAALAAAQGAPGTEPGPQLVPTLAFVGLLGGGAALAWRRRRTAREVQA